MATIPCRAHRAADVRALRCVPFSHVACVFGLDRVSLLALIAAQQRCCSVAYGVLPELPCVASTVATLVRANINVCVTLPAGLPVSTVQAWILDSDYQDARAEFINLMTAGGIDAARYDVVVDSARAGLGCTARNAAAVTVPGPGNAAGVSSYNVMFTYGVRTDAIRAKQIVRILWNLPSTRKPVPLIGSSNGMTLNYGSATSDSTSTCICQLFQVVVLRRFSLSAVACRAVLYRALAGAGACLRCNSLCFVHGRRESITPLTLWCPRAGCDISCMTCLDETPYTCVTCPPGTTLTSRKRKPFGRCL